MKTLKLLSSVFALFVLSLMTMSFTTTSSSASVLLPDLRISKINTPGGLKKGNCNKVSVIVTNPSMAAAKGKIPVILYVSQSGSPTKTYVGYLNGIGPNANYGQAVWFQNVYIAKTGSVTLKARVNPDLQVHESAYNNNIKILKAKVTKVCGQVSTPPQGATLTVTAFKAGEWNYSDYTPVVGAKVKIVKNGQSYIKYTGNNGKASFPNIPTGMCTITVSKYGYQTATRQFNMSSYNNNVNMEMAPY